MPRGRDRPSGELRSALEAARKDLAASLARSRAYQHHGLQGNTAADAVASFLQERLPTRYAIRTCEIVDKYGVRSGEVDVCVYNGSVAAPLTQEKEHALIPIEAVLATIEVKSKLNAQELRRAFRGAKKLRALRPFGSPLAEVRREGAPAKKSEARILNSIFAFDSSVAVGHWTETEWRRVKVAAREEVCQYWWINRVLVLTRGLLLLEPDRAQAKITQGDGSDILYDWFLHFANFLAREDRRRNPLDWQTYADASSPGWQALV